MHFKSTKHFSIYFPLRAIERRSDPGVREVTKRERARGRERERGGNQRDGVHPNKRTDQLSAAVRSVVRGSPPEAEADSKPELYAASAPSPMLTLTTPQARASLMASPLPVTAPFTPMNTGLASCVPRVSWVIVCAVPKFFNAYWRKGGIKSPVITPVHGGRLAGQKHRELGDVYGYGLYG